MKLSLKVVSLVAAASVALLAGPALASAQVTTTWKLGKPITFGAPAAGATRFDGELYAPQNRVYFLGFRQSDNSTSGEVWYYDVATKKYKDTGVAMPTPVTNYQIAALKDGAGVTGFYIFGGRDGAGNIVTTTQAYLPATNTTTTDTMDAWPGTTPSACVSLPAMGVAVFANKAIVMGGVAFSANGCVDEQSDQTWSYDATKAAGSRWTAGKKLTMARGYITPAVLGKTVYAIGGDINSAGTLIAQTTVDASKKGTAAWKAKAALPEACDESQAFPFKSGVLANHVVLAGCGQWPADNPDVNLYDAVANTWALGGTLVESRRNQAGTLIGKSMYIWGGYAADGATVLASSEIGKGAPFSGSASHRSSSAASGKAATS